MFATKKKIIMVEVVEENEKNVKVFRYKKDLSNFV